MSIESDPESSATMQQNGLLKHGGTPRFLDAEQIRLIDEALGSLGEFGELRLIVEKGHLRFLVTQKSFDAYKVKPGQFRREAS